MISLKVLLLTFTGVHLLSSAFILLSRYQLPFSSDSKRELPNTLSTEKPLAYEEGFGLPDQSKYKFVSPYLANKILSILNDETQFDNTDMKTEGKGRAYLGFKKDDNYCVKRQAYFVYNTESLFEETNIVHVHNKHSFIGQIVSSFANGLHADNMQRMKRHQTDLHLYDMMPSASAFFTPAPLYFFYDINKQCSCLSQMSSQIPGCDNIARKHKVAQAVTTYMKKYEDRPQCLAYDRLFPQTWVLSDINECQKFFEKLNSVEYQTLKKERTIVYMKKIPSAHRGEGVQPFNQEEEIHLRKQYQNGVLCGKIHKDIIMQHYIHNPLLLNGHKFDFRMYLLVASTNPLIAYYHDGLLRVSLSKYDATSNDKKVLLTNLALSHQIYDDAQNGKLFQDMGPEELKEAQQWTFDRLQAYLLQQGLISDPNWLDNYLRPEFKKALIHLVRLSSDKYVRHSSFYCLFGVDFMLDTDLKLWFIEANAGPALGGYSKTVEPIISQMVKDHFEIVFGLLRSRMKRVVDYVNMLIEEDIAYETNSGQLYIKNLQTNKEKFNSITKNYFESEFNVSKSNGFEKIIDENEDGAAVYQGLIDASCL